MTSATRFQARFSGSKVGLLALVLCCFALLAGCVVAPYPAAYPTTVSTPANFDRSWDAALGAAAAWLHFTGVIVAAMITAGIVQRRLRHLDLIGVLKTRE